jgi:hypothetical protein
MEFSRFILVLILVIAAVLLSVMAGADAAIKCVTFHACKNTYSQTADYTACSEMTFETLVQKVRVEK